jgi:hypothetical protein
MSGATALNKGGIGPAIPYTGPTVFHTGSAAPPTTTSGTDTTPVVTEEYVAEVFVPVNCQSTGAAILNGTAVAGNVTLILYDSNGGIVANTASTAASGTAAYQQVPWATAPNLKGPAKYFIGIQCNNTGYRLRTHILGNFGASKKTAQTYGTLTALTAPTTFTTALGPIADLY